MTLLYILSGISLAASLTNLFATLFLSNSLFRILVQEGQSRPIAPSVDAGLVEVKESPTYDTRFRR